MPEIGERRVRTATFVVAASDSMVQDKAMADYVCDGVNDHVEIQAALDALPASGGEVKLLDGTYNCEVTITLDSNQTLRSCGRNTILTTATANLIFLSAVGGAGTEKTGIVIADMQIDGGAGSVSDAGIYFEYVDYSYIQNVLSWRHYAGAGSYVSGIYLINSDFNTLIANNCRLNAIGIYLQDSSYNLIADSILQFNDDYGGVYLDTCHYNTISGNLCQTNYDEISLTSSNNNIISANTCIDGDNSGITLDGCNNCTVSGNSCLGNTSQGLTITGDNNTISANTSQGNSMGIAILYCNYCTVSGNTSVGNRLHGIYVTSASHNTISNNTSGANSQVTTNTYDDIGVSSNSDDNNIQGNKCFAGTLANKPQYGINIIDADCDGNLVIDNDLYNDGFGTAPFNDAGTLTTVEDSNRGITIDQIKMFRFMKNTSGAQRVAGDVVSLKAVAAGNEVTAPAAVGERQVYGMVAETINDSAWGLVQVKGKATVLKGTNVGGGNIVIGDNLITENGVRARKAAAATDPIFARALEALAAADGVIDAYIVSPWD